MVLLQIFQIEKTNPKAKPEDDFLSIHKTEAKTASLIKSACYDCHSYETRYPWYTYVVPLSWWIKKHIVNGRKELNFSTWSSYNPKKADDKLEESAEMVSEKKMPLKSYVLAHGEAKLSPATPSSAPSCFKLTVSAAGMVTKKYFVAFLSRKNRFFVFAPGILGANNSDSATVITARCS
jgi:hypothetical protein